MTVDQPGNHRKGHSKLSAELQRIVQRLEIGNIEAFIAGRHDYQLGKPSPPEEGKFGVRALTTIDYFIGWAIAHNENCNEREKLNPNDFGTGCYEGIAELVNRKLSSSYRIGYSLGGKIREE